MVEALIEQAAELAVERYHEDRGYWDARAQEDYERAHGMVDFQAARELWEERFAS